MPYKVNKNNVLSTTVTNVLPSGVLGFIRYRK